MSTEKELEKVKQLLDSAENNIRQAKNILFVSELSERAKLISDSGDKTTNVVEGIFDGQSMIDKNGKTYAISANYASKSKLVYGDVLKLTILEDGTFLYKQIGPVQRKKMIGKLTETGSGEYLVDVDGAEYRVLPASVTYFHANAGDKLTILVPENQVSEWAAVENKIEV